MTMLIPDVVALNSETRPSEPFYVYAKPDTGDIATITQLEFGRASHRAASILRPNGDGPAGQVVAIIALSDTVLFHAIVVGLMTANFVPFTISPRNSAAGIFKLLRDAACHRVLATCTTLKPVLSALENHITEVDPEFGLTIEEIPSLGQIYPNLAAETTACAFQPYSTQLPRASLDDVGLYMHSSGSTGLPKTIAQTHRALMQWATLPGVAEAGKYDPPAGNMALPAFHQFGFICQLLLPLFGMCVAVYPPTASAPGALPVFPSPDNILEAARNTKCKTITVVPALLTAWLHSPPAIAYLRTLQLVAWSGGSLPQRIGDALVDAGLNLVGVYGGTEFGPITALVPRAGDEREWAWFRVADVVKVRWAPQGDGTFECQVLTWEQHQPAVENLGDVRGYGTSDLFVNHPEKKHLWKAVGRVDDVIVHTSGEKTVPAPMEDIVTSSPYVAGAVIFGRDRAQAGILIETIPNLQIDVQDPVQLAELRNKIWPVIEDANEIAPAFSRIFKETILFASADKPLPRAGKGTVMRKAALSLYAPEIESIYETVEEQTSVGGSIKPPAAWEAALIQEWLLELATNLCKGSAITPTVDLFEQGFDSLTATILRLRVISALRSRVDAFGTRAANTIAQNLVYSHPTISQLSTYLEGLVGGTATADTASAESYVEELIAKYTHTSGMTPTRALTPDTGARAVVLLTGSTGNVGSQILVSLLNDDRVAKIYAFNRPAVGQTLPRRQLNIFHERGLDEQLLASPKLVFVEGKTDQKDLGLTLDLYEEIRDSVTLIIHTTWTLDFNMVLASFEPHILGTRNLIDLALSSPHVPRFLFTSSIASAQSWDPSRGPCPESILSDASVALGGYGQSKYVAEQILAKSDLNVSCLRIGQVCGAFPKGAWTTTDWVPILVKTSIGLGLLPLSDGASILYPHILVSWIDFETVAQAILDVAFTPLEISERLPTVMNLVHPRPVSWNSVISNFRDVLLKNSAGSINLRLVDFQEWYKELEVSEAREGYAKENLPGLKLLTFFRHLANSSVGYAGSQFGGIVFAIDKIQVLSPAVRDVSSITKENVEAWVNYWNASGFL
ncbi:putative aminoadipate reductase [Mycena vulgaris]|nr:putative aminoadipate reductase [Mycena vulgaris]